MIGDILWLIFGLALILFGANILTDGASSIAKRLGVSDLVVGLTIVAFGTSAPELVISIISGWEGSAPLAVGNVVGSNIFNIFVIIGIVALVRPIRLEKSVLNIEIPFVALSSLILLVMGNSAFLNGGGVNEVSRVSAIFLIIMFLLFLCYTLAVAKKGGVSVPSEGGGRRGGARSVVYVVGGLAMLIYGGDRFVQGAVGVAIKSGLSEAVVGLTIVAAGTSLPELATSIVAAIKGKPGLAVGNVIGSNIFNVLLVLGLAGVMTPLPFGAIGNFDLLFLLFGSVFFYIFGRFFGQRTVNQYEGLILTIGYVVYITILISNI